MKIIPEIFSINKQPTHLDVEQGTGEQRSETYMQYFERAAEPITQLNAKSSNRVRSFDAEQVATMRRL